ncbi:MAG TPA: DUF1365 domain-containing protein [Thermoanaerobaculia bacterium]|nr:DUF1365 domain-containing protein [Thermoanaerobaculia bacterium]
MNSALYVGAVAHRRRAPRPHAFRFPLALAYLDLDEVAGTQREAEGSFAARWLRRLERPGWLWLRRADYLGDPRQPLIEAVGDAVEVASGERPGAVRLLTQLRTAGVGFNPVSFYYCFAPTPAGEPERLAAVLFEVTNIPWGERQAHVLLPDRGVAVPGGPGYRTDRPADEGSVSPGAGAGPVPRTAGRIVARHAKLLHVSPFFPLELDWSWRLSTPGERLTVAVAVADGDARPFAATLSLRRRPLSARSLAGAQLRFPLQPLQVVAAIHWQAFRLWLKGVPVHDHPHRRARHPGLLEGAS